MLRSAYTSRFQKDLARMLQRGKSAAKLKTLVLALLRAEPLPAKHRDHKLAGAFASRRE